MQVETLSQHLTAVNWADAKSGYQQCRGLIDDALRSGFVRQLVRSLTVTPKLSSKCEELQGISKLVLFDEGDAGVRLRLHVFHQYRYDVAHNHRWSFYSRILEGGYQQTLHGSADGLKDSSDLLKMVPVASAHLARGQDYFLHHRCVHSLRAVPGTVSLVLRGPVTRSRALWADLGRGAVWEHRTGVTDDLKRNMTQDELEQTCRKLLRQDEEANGNLFGGWAR